MHRDACKAKGGKRDFWLVQERVSESCLVLCLYDLEDLLWRGLKMVLFILLGSKPVVFSKT